MQETKWMSIKKTTSRSVWALTAVAGLAFTGNAYGADLAISKQLASPMKPIEGNKYRLDFILRVLNIGQETVSGIVIKDSLKADLEAVTGVGVVSLHAGETPRFITEEKGGQTSISIGNLNPNFLGSPEGTILGDAKLNQNEFLAIRYSVDVDFGKNKSALSTNAKVFVGNVNQPLDTSNNGDVPANDPSYPSGKAADSATTIYFPKYDGSGYVKDRSCVSTLSGSFESSYELIKNGGFTVKNGTPGQLETPIPAGDTLAGSFTSGAQYAGDGAYPHDMADGEVSALGLVEDIRNESTGLISILRIQQNP
jgi:hypothetical protein